MLPQNIIEILKKLDKKELVKFGEFTASPYFNSIGKLEDLYNLIAKEHPGFPEAKLDDKKIFKKLYPGKEFKDKTVKNLYSEFGKILKKFLTYEAIRKDEVMIDLYHVKALAGKGLFEMSNKSISESKQRKEKRGTDYYYYWHDSKLEDQFYKNQFKKSKLNLQEIFNALTAMSESFIAHFVSTFSNLAYNIIWSLKAQNVGYKDRSLEKFIDFFNSEKLLEYLNSSRYRNSVSVKTDYLLFYYFINGFTEEKYYRLKEILIKNIDSYTKADILNYWAGLTSIMLIELNPRTNEVYREIFEISRVFYDQKIYPDEYIEEFPVSLLRNIFTVALVLEEYEWADNFLNEYCDYINPALKKNEINYNKGQLCFKMGKFEESLEYLSKVNFTDIYENLNIRFYLIMNHTELKHFESAASMINTANQFYKSNKDIPKAARQSIKDSLKYFNEIIKYGESGKKLDYSVYRKASGSGGYYHKKYITNKMKGML